MASSLWVIGRGPAAPLYPREAGRELGVLLEGVDRVLWEKEASRIRTKEPHPMLPQFPERLPKVQLSKGIIRHGLGPQSPLGHFPALGIVGP